MLEGWTFEDRGGGIVSVIAPSGKRAALGYLLEPQFGEPVHILRELIIAILNDGNEPCDTCGLPVDKQADACSHCG
jgi:hypothetical protein